jgi:hypothetical protein
MAQAGFGVLRVDRAQGPPEKAAAFIRDRLLSFLAPSEA